MNKQKLSDLRTTIEGSIHSEPKGSTIAKWMLRLIDALESAPEPSEAYEETPWAKAEPLSGEVTYRVAQPEPIQQAFEREARPAVTLSEEERDKVVYQIYKHPSASTFEMSRRVVDATLAALAAKEAKHGS